MVCSLCPVEDSAPVHTHPELNRLQRALLPRTAPVGGSFRTAWFSQPAHGVGGDLVAVASPAPGQLFLLVADVMGHNLEAGFVASAVRGALHMGQQPGLTSPAELLTRLNSVVCELFDEMFVTAAACLLDADRQRITYALAGHPPILVRGPGGVVVALREPSPGLGMFLGERYTESEAVFEKGAAVLLYTDGVADALEGGIADLAALLNDPAKPDARRLVDAVASAAQVDPQWGAAAQEDDCTVLAACYAA